MELLPGAPGLRVNQGGSGNTSEGSAPQPQPQPPTRPPLSGITGEHPSIPYYMLGAKLRKVKVSDVCLLLACVDVPARPATTRGAWRAVRQNCRLFEGGKLISPMPSRFSPKKNLNCIGPCPCPRFCKSSVSGENLLIEWVFDRLMSSQERLSHLSSVGTLRVTPVGQSRHYAAVSFFQLRAGSPGTVRHLMILMNHGLLEMKFFLTLSFACPSLSLIQF